MIFEEMLKEERAEGREEGRLERCVNVLINVLQMQAQPISDGESDLNFWRFHCSCEISWE